MNRPDTSAVAYEFLRSKLEPVDFEWDFRVIKRIDANKFRCRQLIEESPRTVIDQIKSDLGFRMPTREKRDMFVKFPRSDENPIVNQINLVRDAYIGKVLLAGVDCPYIIPPSEFVISSKYGFGVASKFYRYGNLTRIMHDAPIQEVAAVGIQLALGASTLHRAGIIHRDIKPENTVIKGQSAELFPEIALIDFDYSITDTYQQQPKVKSIPTETVKNETDLWRRTTQEHLCVGTTAYCPPEQAKNENSTPLSDLYSIALIIYNMALKTGSEEKNPKKIKLDMLYRVNEGLPDLGSKMEASGLGSDFDTAFCELIMSALIINPEDRAFYYSDDPARKFARALANLPWPDDVTIRQEPFFIEALAA